MDWLKRIGCSLILLLSATLAHADAKQAAPQDKKEPTQVEVPTEIGEDPGPLYTNVIGQWAKLTNFPYNAARVVVGKLQLDIENDPKLKGIWTNEMKMDLEQYFYEMFYSTDTIKELAKLYAQYFTLDDMQDLLAFYKSPIGQKLIKVDPELKVKTQQLGNILLKRHEKEYMGLVGKHIQKSKKVD